MSAWEWVECNSWRICVHCTSESASAADGAEPPLRLRGRILQLTLDSALCILKQPADACPLRAQSRKSHAEVPNLAREWSKASDSLKLATISTFQISPSPSHASYMLTNCRFATWNKTISWFVAIRSLYAQLLPSNQPKTIQFLGESRCSSMLDARFVRLRGRTKTEVSAQPILMEACMKWGCYSRHLWIQQRLTMSLLVQPISIKPSCHFSLRVLLKCFDQLGWNGIFGCPSTTLSRLISVGNTNGRRKR